MNELDSELLHANLILIVALGTIAMWLAGKFGWQVTVFLLIFAALAMFATVREMFR
jgi:hypothetical protein